MQWRMAFKEDSKELRSILASHVGTISLLLMTQSINSISAAEEDRITLAREVENSILENRKILQGVEDKVDVSINNQGRTKVQLHYQAVDLDNLKINAELSNSQLKDQRIIVQDVQSVVSSVRDQNNSIFSAITKILDVITSGAVSLQEIARQIVKIFELLTKFTIEMRIMMTELLQLFSSLRSILQQFQSSLPLKINLPILQFTDALGQTMALPYHICESWTTFKKILSVIFIDRPGKLRVDSGQYVIMQARGGMILTEAIWKHGLKQNDHLLMSIELDDSFSTREDDCPFPSCGALTIVGELKNGGRICPQCFRWIHKYPYEPFKQLPVWLPNEVLENSDGSLLSSLFEGFEEPRNDEPNRTEESEDIELYRQVHAKEITFASALSYIDNVKVYFAKYPVIYRQFLELMHEFRHNNTISTADVFQRIKLLFHGHPELIQAFCYFLPLTSRDWKRKITKTQNQIS